MGGLGEDEEGGGACEEREAGRLGARSAGADTGISFRLGAFPFYKIIIPCQNLPKQVRRRLTCTPLYIKMLCLSPNF